MKKLTLKEQATEILDSRCIVKDEQNQDFLEKLEIRKLEILKQFKAAFSDIIPQLENENIIFTVHFQDDRYEHKGVYIKFVYHDKTLKMDFNNAKSYRYEHILYNSEIRGTMVYGEWSMDEFILFIVKGLHL